MKKARAIVFVVLSLVLCFSASLVSAEKSKKIIYATQNSGGQVDLQSLSEAERESIQKRNDELGAFFLEKAKVLGKLTKENGSINSVQAEVDNLEQKAESIGLIKVTEFDPVVNILSSSNSDFNWDVQQFYKDSKTGRYIWEAQGQFSNKNVVSECFCSPYYRWYDLGGDDGFGLASLHKDINIYSSGFWTLHDDLSTDDDHSSNISTINARGAGWSWQDKVYANPPLIKSPTYDSYRRLGWINFTFVGGTPTGQQISFQANTAHTWDSTSVNGISIGGGGVSFSWTSQGSQWTKATSKVVTVQ